MMPLRCHDAIFHYNGPMNAPQSTRATVRSSRRSQARSFSAEVFEVVADRLAGRADAIALFAETGCSFEDWCTWEALAACRQKAWTVQPRPRYADVGVAGSREVADLMVFDPATGRRVLLELAIIHDWTTNKWIDALNGDTDRLRRAAAAGVEGFQVIVTVSLASPVDVNPTWQGWLGMSRIFKEPGRLTRAMPLGAVGQLALHGWEIGKKEPSATGHKP